MAALTGLAGVAGARHGDEERRRRADRFRADLEVVGQTTGDLDHDVRLLEGTRTRALLAGTIPGRNSCVDAELVGVEAHEYGVPAVRVRETYEGGICLQALTSVAYDLSVASLSHEPIDAVLVVHEGEDGSVEYRERVPVDPIDPFA